MTREKAMEILRHCVVENRCYDGICGNCEKCDRRIALDMAIEALKREDTMLKEIEHIMLYGERSEDLISRAEAIEAIEETDWYHQNKNKDMVHGANSDEHQAWYKAQDIYKALEAVPSADRPKGEWISREIKNNVYGGKYQLTCPFCDDSYIVSEQARPYERFCRYCGADMRGEEE